ncbi:MAG TPA: hypothetical protein VJ853_11095, partial [Thermoanaerobaculia bacterium]|nr:hypothetical protein [Thermoanaerobaculia bacterium]
KIYVVDASLRGMRISHRTLFSPRVSLPITFEFDGNTIDVTGSVRWTKLQRLGPAAFAKSVYQSGLEIVSMPRDAEAALRGLVQHQVELALDEQKANANGVPPFAAQSVRTRNGQMFGRHELIHGVWRKTVTHDPAQPLHGFTISPSERKSEVDLLRSAYEIADPQMRRIIQRIAELTLSNSEGIPMRRYTP